MKKKLFLLRMFGKAMVIAVLAFGLVLAGCATKGGSGTPPAPVETAVQLAADLNAIKAGSATADGATVRLTGEVYLTTGLTVPSGVTLDLTADKAKFELQNGAELTVDGTVNTSGHGDHGKGWVEGGLRIGDGTAVINGSGSINLKSKGSALNISGDKRHLTIDGVTLAGIKDNDRSLVNVDNGGELVLKSGAISGNTFISEVSSNGGGGAQGGGVNVYNGTFTMEGGEISGNTANGVLESKGGGVSISDGATFTMKGGTISDNTTEDCEWNSLGGGVFVLRSTFTMEGGVISGNRAVKTNGDSYGGGIQIEAEAVFTLKGGTIYGKSDKLPAGVDASLANSATTSSLDVRPSKGNTAKWGTGGTYTKGDVSQTGGSDILKTNEGRGTNDTLIAVPAR